jgi:hypothetical protein
MMNAPAVFEPGPSGLAAMAGPTGGLATINPEALILRAIDQGLPVESLERLLAMRADLKRELAAGEFARALADFQTGLPSIHKGRVAKVQSARGSYSYRYADIGDIMRAIAPQLRTCGLAVTFDTRAEGEALIVGCIVHHVAGHSIRAEFPVPVDRAARMNAAQQIGSALTYGRRYALCAALGIVTADEDDDGQAAVSQPAPAPQRAPTGSAPPAQSNGAPINEAQHRRLEARIGELGLDRARVKAWVLRAWGVQHLTEVPRDRYSDLDRRLDLWAEAATEAQAERAAIQGEPQPNADWVADYDTANH